MTRSKLTKILIVSIDSCENLLIYPEGPLYIAKYLEEYADVRIYPISGNTYQQDLQNTLENFNPDVVFISIRDLLDLNKNSHDLIDSIKRSCANILVGGSAPTIFQKETEYVLKLEKNQMALGEFEANYSKNFVKRKYLGDLDDISMPDSKTIHRIISLNNGFFPKQKGIECKRGCVFRCLYCSYPYLGGGEWRVRNVETVCNNIKELYEHGIDDFFFTDSIFNIPRDYCVKMLESLLPLGVQAKFGAFIYPKFTSYEVDLWSKLNFKLELGVDGISDKSLAAMNKPFNVNDVKKSVKMLKAGGVDFNVYIILGVPGQTLDDIKREIDILSELDPPLVWITVGITIYPISPLYGLAREEGFIRPDELLIPEKRYYPKGLTEDKIRTVVESRKLPHWGVTYSQHTENITLFR